MAPKYCFCCENVKAAKILGIIGIILYAISVIYYVYAFTLDYDQAAQAIIQSNPRLSKEQQEAIKMLFEKVKTMVVIMLVSCILGLVANACLVAGTIKNNKNLVLVWIVMSCLGGILLIANMGYGIANGGSAGNLISALIGLGFFIW